MIVDKCLTKLVLQSEINQKVRNQSLLLFLRNIMHVISVGSALQDDVKYSPFMLVFIWSMVWKAEKSVRSEE